MELHNSASQIEGFNAEYLLRADQPLPNDDPGLKQWIAATGSLYINRAVVGVRSAVPGEKVDTWVHGPDGLVLERSVVAKVGQLVVVGMLGEQYIPQEDHLRKHKAPVGEDGLREDEMSPPLPDDGHSYQLWRPKGNDYRMVVGNPHNANIYLLTSSGRLQVGVPGGKIAAQIEVPPMNDAGVCDASLLGVARFIAPAEFAVSYQPITKD